MSIKPFKVFYGWWIVGACFFIWLASTGIAHYGFTALFEPIKNEFGWSYTQISFAASLRAMEVGFLSPLTGYFADRSGPRRLMFIGAFCIGLGLILLSLTSSLAMFYGAFFLVGIGVSTCTGTVPMTVMANWFRKKISIALGIMTCGAGFSGLLVPLIVSLIDSHGWRTTVAIIGIGVFAIIVPLSLVVRSKPEKYGYLPDGETEDVKSSEVHHSVRAPEINISARQALKSATFWRLTVSFILYIIMVNAVIAHVMPFLSTIGIARSVAGFAASAIAMASIIGRLGSDWFGDRLDRRWITSVNLVLMSLGFLLVSFVSPDTTWVLVPFLVFFSIGYGGNFIMIAALVKEYFGRSNFGAISGFMMGMVAFGGLLGPLMAGVIVDRWGSYQLLWPIFTGLAIVAIVGVATARKV